MEHPLTMDQAWDLAEGWLSSGVAVTPEPDLRHLSRVRSLIAAVSEQGGVGGALVSDAHLAALAIQHRATLISFDRDFERFPGLHWEMPS